MTEIQFSELGLAEPIQRALRDRNHEIPTPIQAQAIPPLLEGQDLLGIAQTGTGKTGAFSLPMLHKLSRTPGENRPDSPRALILAPTRELAIQIGDELRAYGKYSHLRQTVIFGGVSQYAQVKALSRGVEILIATPGRLLDLVRQKKIRLDAVEYFVLDEADRMFDMGFIHDVRKLVSILPKDRQSLLFSATVANKMMDLLGEVLTNPVKVEVAPHTTPVERIRQSVHHVKSADKTGLLAKLLEEPEMSKVIVFSRTKHRADRIATHLSKEGIEADAIHGNKSQGARQRALKQFRSGDVRVLVATDIAARGIDISGVSHVINYELPNEADSYVHRIGRTARAGADGVAISFCDPTEREYLRDIESLIQQRIEVIGEGPSEEEMEYSLKPQKRRPRGKRPQGAVKAMTRPQEQNARKAGAERKKPQAGKSGQKKAKTWESKSKTSKFGDKKDKPWESNSKASKFGEKKAKPWESKKNPQDKTWSKSSRPQPNPQKRKPGGNFQRPRKRAA